MTRKCAKCRDQKRWSKAEDVNGDGVLWHWFKHGEALTALAKRCMNQRTRWNGRRYVLVQTGAAHPGTLGMWGQTTLGYGFSASQTAQERGKRVGWPSATTTNTRGGVRRRRVQICDCDLAFGQSSLQLLEQDVELVYCMPQEVLPFSLPRQQTAESI
jgi:hypothetical protein